MARVVRVEYEGAWYHVMARGNRREAIFLEEGDRGMMVETLGEACEKSGWEVHAWVLMDNHFHFVIRTPRANLVEGMKWFMNTYTRRLNSAHRLWGRVFGDRYKALVIEAPEHGGELDYLRQVLWYVHLNPVRAGLMRRAKDGRWGSYGWSSLVQAYGVTKGKRPPWMRVGTGLNLEGLSDSASGRRAYRRIGDRLANEWKASEARKRKDPAEREGGYGARSLSHGWYLGGAGFRDWLLDRLEEDLQEKQSRNYRGGPQGHDHGLARAEWLLQAGCRCFGVKEEAMRGARGGDPRRLAVADAIWRQTNVGQGWIAERLGMRTAANVSQQLRRCRDTLGQRLGAKAWKEWQKESRFVA